MKNIYDVLKAKEAELAQVEKEVEALQFAARLLADDPEPLAEAMAAAAAPPTPMPRVVPSPAAVVPVPTTKDAATPWPASPRQFP